MIYGPNTAAVASIIDRVPAFTEDECKRLAATRDATLAAVTYDLATIDGPYTITHRDLLLAPWVSVCGMPEGLIATTALDGES